MGVRFPPGNERFSLLPKSSRPTVGVHSPANGTVSSALSAGAERPDREVSFNADVKNALQLYFRFHMSSCRCAWFRTWTALSALGTVKPAYSGAAGDRHFLLLQAGSVSYMYFKFWSSEFRIPGTKIFLLRTGFLFAQVPFKTGFTVCC